VRRRTGLVAALLVAAVLAGGCSIPTESGPRTIAPDRVPFHLLSPVASASTTTLPRLSSLVPVKVYFLGPNQLLQPADRVVVSPAQLTEVINALLAGPSSSEVAKGTSTAIPSNVRVLSAAVQGGIVTVNFDDAFGAITGSATELAVAQVVATITGQVGLSSGVIFEINGGRTSVPIASGAQVPGPVYLLEFLPSSP
jgi:hypothetical protein